MIVALGIKIKLLYNSLEDNTHEAVYVFLNVKAKNKQTIKSPHTVTHYFLTPKKN
jgi:hypothetical protein